MDKKNLTPCVEGLTSLELRNLECLVDKTKENLPTGAMFTNLVNLDMQNMNGLKILCNGQPPKCFLQNLEILTLEQCKDISKKVEPKNLLSSAQIGLPRLQNLLLWNLKKLTSFGPNNYFIKAPALGHLKVIDCPLLTNFSIQQDRPLQLKV